MPESSHTGGGRARDRDRGAALVELAVVLPVLVLLLFGLLESGWIFGQHLELRHGAREGGRLAAVDYGSEVEIVKETCARLHFSAESTPEVRLQQSGTKIGDSVAVTVRAPIDTLTGLLDGVFAGTMLQSTVETRLEQDASWSPTPGFLPCP